METEEGIVAKSNSQESLTEFKVELEDTPQNRQRLAGAFQALANYMTAGHNISFGMGLRKKEGTVVLEAGFNNPRELTEIQKLLK